MSVLLKTANNRVLTLLSTRSISLSSFDLARKPPKEEYENNITKTRKRTSEPFDRYENSSKFKLN